MIDLVFDRKEFSFSGVDIGCIMSSFSNDFLTSMSIRD